MPDAGPGLVSFACAYVAALKLVLCWQKQQDAIYADSISVDAARCLHPLHAACHGQDFHHEPLPISLVFCIVVTVHSL